MVTIECVSLMKYKNAFIMEIMDRFDNSSINLERCDKMREKALRQNIFYETITNLEKDMIIFPMSILKDSNRDPKNPMHKRDNSLLSAMF